MIDPFVGNKNAVSSSVNSLLLFLKSISESISANAAPKPKPNDPGKTGRFFSKVSRANVFPRFPKIDSHFLSSS